MVLVASPVAGQGWSFAIAEAAAKRVVHLNLPFRSTERNVHLAPGGKVVLAQESNSGSVPGLSVTTGRLALLDSLTGAVTKMWTDPNLAGKSILALTPTGQLIAYRGESTTFTSIGLHLSNEPVINLDDSLGPWFFYASR